MIIEFEDCELDLDRVVLRRAGVEIAVEPQVFGVLAYLIERRGHVVRKEEILDIVWGDRFVSESALTSRLKSARRAVGDDGSRQAVIRTVHGRGYEFIADVRLVEPDPEPEPLGSAGRVNTPDLPASLQRLIGRDELLERLVADLAESRLITLVGTAGVGKTSVGLELARSVAHDYDDGVYVAELVTVADGDAAMSSLAGALGVNSRRESSIEEAIVDMLRERRALLVIDNCEHLVEPIAELVERILRNAPNVSIVATSREPLAVAGEHVRDVEPLPVVVSDSMSLDEVLAVPAVSLFMERARAADPNFELSVRTRPGVVEICRRLDGIPLALELAAARAKAIDVVEIADRLDERFRLLRGVRRGSDPRHRTLQDAIGWSYELLDDDEQRVFTSLAVFAGPFDLAAAESICDDDVDDVLDVLTRLTERSMLAVRRSRRTRTRYEMLETLREYGRNRLDDERSVTLHTAHAGQFNELAAAVESALDSSGERDAVARADGSFADLRAAQRFTVEIGDVDTAFALVCSMREYAMRTLHYEVFSWADQAAELADGCQHRRFPLLTAVRAYGAFARGQFDRSLELAAQAAEAEHRLGVEPTGLVQRVRANVCYAIDEVEQGLTENDLLIEIAETSGNDSRRAHAYYMASVAASSCGDYERGRQLSERSRQAATLSGGVTDMAGSWVAEGYATRGDDHAARSALAHADRLARSVGNRWMSAFARTEASGLRVWRGEVHEGSAELADLVDLWYRAGEWAQQWHTLMRSVIALDRLGQPAVAAEVLGSIEAHSAVGTPPFMWTLRQLVMETRDSLDEQLGVDVAAQRRSTGARLPVATTVERTRRALRGLPVDA